MAKYDVFISCKSEDYKYAEEVYEYLKSQGIHAFLASMELRRKGESEFRRAISEAMEEAYHIIVFASNPNYINSSWVYYEWDMFVNAKLVGKKMGNIITLLKDISRLKLPMALIKYESFQFDNYQDGILKYVETPDSKARAAEKMRWEEEERQRKKEEETARIRELNAKLTSCAEGYKKSVSSLQVDIDKIYSLLEEIGIYSRECPICHTGNPIRADVCDRCGWPISPLDGLPSLGYLNRESKNRRQKFSDIYNEYLSLKASSGVEPERKECAAEQKKSDGFSEGGSSGIDNQGQSSPKSKSEMPEKEDEYILWVEFCPSSAEKLIEKVVSDIEFPIFRACMAAGQSFPFVAYSSKYDANTRKNVLERKGATVEIRTGNLSQERSRVFKTFVDEPSLRRYGVEIRQCGSSIEKVAESLTQYYKRSVSSFRSVLQTLPYRTPPILTILEAQDLLVKLDQLGADSVVVINPDKE